MKCWIWILGLLLLLTQSGAQPEASRSRTESPAFNVTGERRVEQETLEPRVFTEDGQLCSFPFRYGGRMHHSCTSNAGSLKKWCATTHNYDRDRRWGYCIMTPKENTSSLDYCASSPCRNGGSCSNSQDFTSYHCACPEEFTGKDCEMEKCFDDTRYEYFDIDESWPRIHQGVVEWCNCSRAHIDCEKIRYTACINNPCLHDSVCRMIVSTGKTICACQGHYTGKYCNIVPGETCYLGNGTDYRGIAKKTISGQSCLPWNSDLLYQELHVDSVEKAVHLGLGPHSYCRNPDSDEKPWCYIMKDNTLSWEYCNISACVNSPRSGARTNLEFFKVPEISQPNRRACGKRHKKRTFLRPRIIGGSSSLPGSHPWMAALYIGESFCAGSLIHSCWVVSAAHCFSNSPPKSSVTVVLGQHFFNTSTDVTQSFEIEKYILYPLYSVFNPSNHDLALIRLKKKGDRCATKSQFVQPICLPDNGITFPDNHKCQIAGWGHMYENVTGYSSYLREALLPLIPDHKCSSPEVYGADITPNMFCAGYFDCKSDACQGDSGGPLACEKNGVSYLYGIISWGDGCGRFYKPGVYTRVTNYVDWINDKIWPPKKVTSATDA
ncbi:hepatocyte growth factor activator [Vombatus ursinus]|uniref:Hepatocyte growth factor activator serine protease n=1 Tax=Vombatus ursinus TaxID=29139 RepID=A0A4X2M4K1_VOMUR|nr:hepatocyte growth factor activator [Vombatus ursinus]